MDGHLRELGRKIGVPPDRIPVLVDRELALRAEAAGATRLVDNDSVIYLHPDDVGGAAWSLEMLEAVHFAQLMNSETLRQEYDPDNLPSASDLLAEFQPDQGTEPVLAAWKRNAEKRIEDLLDLYEQAFEQVPTAHRLLTHDAQDRPLTRGWQALRRKLLGVPRGSGPREGR